ncbi:unnamed protein product [Periconia digitata]|uniref:Uncharacterized protein n=1 Tax=Periconia digitata TaxID=1303443 RepID=A0A9W4XSQ5_9PLEO|nr:unnamed protein product [Periconia digitata]
MFNFLLFLAFTGLIQAAPREIISINTDSGLIPKLSSDFNKNNVSSQWAPGFPKEWGAEDFRLQFSEPDPEGTFSAAVSSDEKYLVMVNGTHVTFVDIDTKATATTLGWELPEGYMASDLTLRNVPQGGYDVLVNFIRRQYDTPVRSARIRLSADFERVGSQVTYTGGFGAISKQGKYATLSGYIYELDNASNSTVILDQTITMYSVSFSSNGDKLSSVEWNAQTADIWNTTTGKRIYDIPPTKAQNWVTRISPDGMYVAYGLGSGKNIVQLWTLSNFTKSEITGFRNWPRHLEWSPDNKYLAVGDYGRVQVWKLPEFKLVQTWMVENYDPIGVYENTGFAWLDGGKKFSFRYNLSSYLYDLEENTKWAVSPSTMDHTWGEESLFYLKSKGMLATVNGDSRVRFWKV